MPWGVHNFGDFIRPVSQGGVTLGYIQRYKNWLDFSLLAGIQSAQNSNFHFIIAEPKMHLPTGLRSGVLLSCQSFISTSPFWG